MSKRTRVPLDAADIALKPACADHSRESAELIYMSSPELFRFLFGDYDLSIAVLSKLYRSRYGHFSHRFATQIYYRNELAGLVLGYTAAQLARQELIGGVLMLLNTPVANWRWLIRAGRILDGYVPKPSRDAFYGNNLAVAPEFRGSSMGSRLFRHFMETAAQHGCRAFELDVTAHNDVATGLYEKRGFAFVSDSEEIVLSPEKSLPKLRRMRLEL